jgi:polyhydroxyalkanoate synthesis regulator phasin
METLEEKIKKQLEGMTNHEQRIYMEGYGAGVREIKEQLLDIKNKKLTIEK